MPTLANVYDRISTMMLLATELEPSDVPLEPFTVPEIRADGAWSVSDQVDEHPTAPARGRDALRVQHLAQITWTRRVSPFDQGATYRQLVVDQDAILQAATDTTQTWSDGISVFIGQTTILRGTSREWLFGQFNIVIDHYVTV